MKRTVCILFLCAITRFGFSQSMFSFAPWEYGLSTSASSQLNSQSILISAARVVPIRTLLPQITGDSYLHTLGFYAGTQFADSFAQNLRFRIVGAKTEMQRAYTSGGLTLIDFDQSGLRHRQATWFGVNFGPGFHVQIPRNALWMRVQGGAELSSIEDGTLLFRHPRYDYKTGFVYTIAARGGAIIRENVTFEASAEREQMTQRTIRRDQLMLSVRFRPSMQLSFSAGYALEEYTSGTQSVQVDTWTASIRFTPGLAGY